MNLGICTIQRDRARWLDEWVAFHYLVGFRKFYVFAHRCTDETHETLVRLGRHFDIQAFALSEDLERPQLQAYQYAYQRFGQDVDWLAFIDGDEFLFPAEGSDLRRVLERYQDHPMSALAAYWMCFGSSGHVREPQGLLLQNYTRRPPADFEANRHVKSIVRGGLGLNCRVGPNAHLFQTPQGTCDELLRPVTQGRMDALDPSHEHLRINHYVCQSLEFFRTFKQHSGAADAGRLMVRPDSWWTEHDRNDLEDPAIQRFLPALLSLLQEIGSPVLAPLPSGMVPLATAPVRTV